LFVTATAVVGVVYKSIQRPDRIVIDMSSGRTVMINNRELGATEAVRVDKDKLQIPAVDFFVGEAMVEVTKDQTVVRLAMARHASVLIECRPMMAHATSFAGDAEMVRTAVCASQLAVFWRHHHQL
jgi:hypothetical protein